MEGRAPGRRAHEPRDGCSPHFLRIYWQLPPGGWPGGRRAGAPCPGAQGLRKRGVLCGHRRRLAGQGTGPGPGRRMLTWPSWSPADPRSGACKSRWTGEAVLLVKRSQTTPGARGPTGLFIRNPHGSAHPDQDLTDALPPPPVFHRSLLLPGRRTEQRGSG